MLHQQASGAEAFLHQDFLEEGLGAGGIGADGHAFAGGESIELQHGGVFPCDGGEGLFMGIHDRGHGGGNVVSEQERFRKLLTGFQLCRLLVRAPAGDAGFFTEIGEALVLDQIAFLTGDTEVDFFCRHPVDQLVKRSHGHRLSERKNGVTSGVAIQLRLVR